MRFLAAYIMRGRMQAMLVASSLAILSLMLPPVSVVSSATVALVTLRLGAFEGLMVLLSSAAAAALLGIIVFNNYYFALLYALVLWLPIWLLAVVLREGRQLSLALESAMVLGMVVVVGFYVYNGNPSILWQGLFEQMAQPLLQNASSEQLEKVHKSIALFARIMTGIVASGAVYSMLFGLFLGRWWQAVLYNPGGFRDEYLNLRINRKLALGSLIIAGVGAIGLGTLSELALNICVLFFVLYTVIGAAALHVLLSRLQNQQARRFLVPMLYITLLVVPQVMILVALVGLVDVWLDLRNKQSKQNSA